VINFSLMDRIFAGKFSVKKMTKTTSVTVTKLLGKGETTKYFVSIYFIHNS